MVISVVLANQSLDRERAQRESARRATCLVVQRMIDVYSDPTPITETGQNAAQAWRDLGLRFGC